MAFPYTTINVSYGTSSSALLNIPAGASFDDFCRNIFKGGGFWTVQGIANNQPATATFIPSSEITSITAS